MYNQQMYMNQNMAMANANMANMNMTGLPMLGVAGTGGMFNNMFMYHGNSIGLQSRLQQINQQSSPNIRQATISCTGMQVSETSICCILCTAIWGGILIFPLCFMCCDWWKRIAYASYNIPQVTYQSLQNLLALPNLQTLSLMVVDNRFNKQKAQILYNILSQSHLKGFTFVNGAMNFDLQSDQYSNFEDHMRPIKKLPIMSEMKWYTKLVI